MRVAKKALVIAALALALTAMLFRGATPMYVHYDSAPQDDAPSRPLLLPASHPPSEEATSAHKGCGRWSPSMLRKQLADLLEARGSGVGQRAGILRFDRLVADGMEAYLAAAVLSLTGTTAEPAIEPLLRLGTLRVGRPPGDNFAVTYNSNEVVIGDDLPFQYAGAVLAHEAFHVRARGPGGARYVDSQREEVIATAAELMALGDMIRAEPDLAEVDCDAAKDELSSLNLLLNSGEGPAVDLWAGRTLQTPGWSGSLAEQYEHEPHVSNDAPRLLRAWMVHNGKRGAFSSFDAEAESAASGIVAAYFDQSRVEALARALELATSVFDASELSIEGHDGSLLVTVTLSAPEPVPVTAVVDPREAEFIGVRRGPFRPWRATATAFALELPGGDRRRVQFRLAHRGTSHEAINVWLHASGNKVPVLLRIEAPPGL